MNRSDPTDNALAAIASIRDQPEAHREPEKPAIEEKPVAAERLEAEGYFKSGPGLMQALRFKWKVRRDENGEYYVDETIGENSSPIISGPMTREAAIKFVDDSEAEARRRFELLKSEMSGERGTVGAFARKDGR